MIHENRRSRMIERLRGAGITEENVLKVMAKVPRHLFTPMGFEMQAYDEKALPIGQGQTISHPYTVALMTQYLQIKKGDKILEIGTGSGYQTAILCELGARVYTIEIEPVLCERANKTLKSFNYRFVSACNDGSAGWAAYGPYDGIIVTAGAPVVPDELIRQLNPGGVMVIPVGDMENQQLHIIKNDGEIKTETVANLKFVPLVGKKGWYKDK